MRQHVLALLCVLLVSGGSQGVGQVVVEEPSSSPQPVLVSLETWPPNPRVEQFLDRRGGEVRERFDAARTLLVHAPGPAVDAIEEASFVGGVYPDEKIKPLLASSKTAAGVPDRMHEANVTGEGVKLAVVDSGIAASHPGLDDAVVEQYSVDDAGVHEGGTEPSKHGTHVAGILAGSGERAPASRGDVSGLAPGASITSFDISSDFTTANALRAFEWIYEHHEEAQIQGVVNAWGRLEEPATYDPDDPVLRGSSALVSEGLVVVFSAGNGGGEDSRMTVEATNPDVISVGAATDEGQVEAYSSVGPVYDQDGTEANWTKPDLVAPGSHVISTQPAAEPGPRYIEMNGTSMAAPHVAAAAALLLGERPDLTPQQLEGLLVRGARDVGPEGIDDASGAGMLDVASSMRILERSSDDVERRSHTEQHSSRLTGPSEAGVVLSQANVEHEDAFQLTVPENATRIELELSWDGRGGLDAALVRPDGAVAHEFTVEQTREVRLDDPEAGGWRIQVEPSEPSRGRYHANATVTWLQPVNGTTLPFSAERSAEGRFPSTGGSLDPFASSWVPGVPNIVPMLGGAILTVTMLVGRIRD